MTIKEQIESLIEKVDALVVEAGDIRHRVKRDGTKGNLGQLLDCMSASKRLKSSVAELRKVVDTGNGPGNPAIFDFLEKIAATLMVRTGVDSVKGEEHSFNLDADVLPSVPGRRSEHYPSWLAWLRDNGYEDAIHEDVSWQTAKKLLAEHLASGKPVPDFVKCTTIPKISMRKRS